MASSVAAYIGLGSNLDDPTTQLERAINGLERLPATRIVARSSFYVTPPMGPQNQPDYVNAVAALATTLAPTALLAALQAIERAQGRVRAGQRWGPRTIDLDMLLYGDLIIDEPGLKVPHPGVSTRAFVLIPLAEIAHDLLIPGHASVHELLAQIDSAGVVRLGSSTCNSRILRNR